MEELKKETDIVHPDIKKKIERLIEDETITDYKIEITSGSEKGDNYLGVIAKVRIEGKDRNGGEVVKNWIVKSAPQQEMLRQMIQVDKVYEREVYMYENVFPLFLEFQAEKETIDTFDYFPKYVASCLEPLKETLIMKDMKSVGYVMKNRKEPLDYNHVRLVMKAYGRMHALSYALKDQRPEVFKRIADNTKDQFFAEQASRTEQIEKQQELYCEKVLAALDPVMDARAIELYKKYSSKTNEVLLDAINAGCDNPYSVVGHGDSWVNNMLFKYDNEENPDIPTRVCLLDWQLARYGSPAFDLSYFIFTCTDKSLRDKHYDDMIKIYYYSLCAHLADLGGDPEKMLPYHALQAELKRYSILGLYISVLVLFLMMSDKEEIPDWGNSKTEEELMEVMTYKTKNEKQYNERVRGIVIDFVDKGYFDFLN